MGLRWTPRRWRQYGTGLCPLVWLTCGVLRASTLITGISSPSLLKSPPPLHQLTKMEARFEWSEACQEAFDSLNQALVEAPVLPYPDSVSPYSWTCKELLVVARSTTCMAPSSPSIQIMLETRDPQGTWRATGKVARLPPAVSLQSQASTRLCP